MACPPAGADHPDGPDESVTLATFALDVVAGFVAGVFAFVVGFTVTALGADPGEEIELLEGLLPADEVSGVPVSTFLPEWYQVLGWEFLANHHVDVSVEMSGGLERAEFVAEYVDTLLPTASELQLVPPVLLLAAGFLVARRHPREDALDAVRAGATVVVGYLPGIAVVLSVASFEVVFPVGDVVLLEVSPDLGKGVVAGLAYPVVFGGLGGVLSLLLARG